GLGLLIVGLAVIVASGTWWHIKGPFGEALALGVEGTFGRLAVLVPLLLLLIAWRFLRHPDNVGPLGRVIVGWGALAAGVLGIVHISFGLPAPADGMAKVGAAGGLIGYAAATPLVAAVSAVVAVPLLVLLALFGVLVVTATPVHAIPERFGV